jgi:hypothetical protein
MPLTLRLVKGSELTYAELDGNFTFITGSFTPLSITSSMSVATASNITPAIASNGNDRIITSDGDGTVTAEANFTFNGSALRVTGSLTVSGSGTLTNIGPARFRSTTVNNSPSTTALEITGGLQVSGSIDSVNKYLIDNDGVTSVSWNGRRMFDTSGNEVVSWNNYTLNDTSANPSVDWETKVLTDTSAVASIDWDTRRQYDTTSTIAINYDTRVLYAGGITSVDWTARRLYDSASVVAIGYNTRTLTDNVSKTAMIWTNATRSLYDVNASASIDWKNRTLKNATGVTVVDYAAGDLYDSLGVKALDWIGGGGSRTLYDSNASASIDWSSRHIKGEQPSGVSYVKIDYSTAYSTTIQSISGSGATATTASIVVSNNHNTSDIGGVLLSSYIGTQGSTLSVGKAVNIDGAGGLILRGGSSFQITASAGYNPTLYTYISSSYFAPVTFNNPLTVNNQITVVGSPSYVVLTTVSQSLNFANDTAAAAGGVPLGGLYRNGSFIMIRMS